LSKFCPVTFLELKRQLKEGSVCFFVIARFF